MKRLSIILIPLLFIFTACSDDDTRNGNPNNGNPNYANPHLSGTSVNASFAGRITNSTGAPVVNALVQIGSKSSQTNAFGFYSISNATTDRDYAVISVTANGFFKQFRSLKPRTDQKNFVDIEMINYTFNGFFEASTGGTVSIPGGASAIFPAGALTDEQGNAYTGQVILATTYLNPTDPRLPTYMPGSLQAVSSEGENVAMITYGMIGVELLSGSGQPLKLAQGKKATLEFPVQTEQTAHAPQTIPLWFFDEISGIWREEGMATRIGDKYMGEVSHFSFWNCDVPAYFTFLEGIIVDAATQAPISNAYVKLTRSNGSYATAWVGYNGLFSGYVYIEEVLAMSVITSNCTDVETYVMDIGPFSSAPVDLGSVSVSLPSQTSLTISGTVTDCDGITLSGIAVSITHSQYDWSYYYITDGSGNFTATYPCLSSGTASFELIDLDNLSYVAGGILSYDASVQPEYNMGSMLFCAAEELANYMTYSEGSNSFNFVQVQAADSTEGCVNIVGTLNQNFTSSFLALSLAELNSTGPATPCDGFTSNVYYFVGPNELYYATFSNFQVNITQLQMSGDFYALVKGTYTADVAVTSNVGGTQQSYTSTASGTFRYEP